MKEELDKLLKKYQKEIVSYNQKNHYYVFIRTLLLVLFIVLIIAGMKIPAIKSYFMILFFILIFLFLVVYFRHQKIKKELEKYNTSVSIIEEYYKRISGEWINFKDTGMDIVKDNYVLFDLDIVGEHSLFQYLNIAKSKGGRKKLINRLSNPELKDLKNDQEAVEELKNKLDFVINFQMLLNKVKGDLSEKIDVLSHPIKNHIIILYIHCLFSCVTLLLGILSLFNRVNSRFFTMSVLLQISYSFIIDKINAKEFNCINTTSSCFRYIYPIYELISHSDFNSVKMKEIKANINSGKRILKSLNKIYDLNTFRHHFLGYILANGIFPLNGYLLYSFYKITINSFNDLKKSIDCFEDLESLISLSVVGVCKENVCIPIVCENIELSFENILHPLLKEETCVSNTFKCEDHINIITGSNMSGKTSFMRTIAMNLIMMYAGGYVNASSFKAPYLKIFTSMRVNDNIEKGISTFYGELLRIKDIIDYKDTNLPFIVFIDEIFKGTNYNDRIYGAKEVIKNISKNNSIIFISTHDFELCEIDNDKIRNYYFEEYYEENKIKFDYKIRIGKCKTTNARFLMKQLEIIK